MGGKPTNSNDPRSKMNGKRWIPSKDKDNSCQYGESNVVLPNANRSSHIKRDIKSLSNLNPFKVVRGFDLEEKTSNETSDVLEDCEILKDLPASQKINYHPSSNHEHKQATPHSNKKPKRVPI